MTEDCVGGVAREYFSQLVASYGKTLVWDKPFSSKGGGPATGGAYSIEPHVAERVFNDLARGAQVPVHFHARLAGTRKAELTSRASTTLQTESPLASEVPILPVSKPDSHIQY